MFIFHGDGKKWLNCTRTWIDMGNGLLYVRRPDGALLYCMSDTHHSLSSLSVCCFGGDHMNSALRDKYSYCTPRTSYRTGLLVVSHANHSLHTVSWPILNTLFYHSHKCSRRSSRWTCFLRPTSFTETQFEHLAMTPTQEYSKLQQMTNVGTSTFQLLKYSISR